MTAPLITLTTDFGAGSYYVGVMKGVIHRINPQAQVVDLCHTIEPQQVKQAAFVLSASVGYFAEGSIHVAVVDPGVGSERLAIALRAPAGTVFVAPDNGVLSLVLPSAELGSAPNAQSLKPRPLPEGYRAVALTEPRYWLSPLSATFHGRDIFAPVAAHLSLGEPLGRFGVPLAALLCFPSSRPIPLATGGLQCHAIHVDSFGNLITDARRQDLPAEPFSVLVAGRQIEGLSPSYMAGGELLALIGSAGYLEVAARNASAARLLGIGVGAEVLVLPRA